VSTNFLGEEVSRKDAKAQRRETLLVFLCAFASLREKMLSL
jgi:hypothetical protein